MTLRLPGLIGLLAFVLDHLAQSAASLASRSASDLGRRRMERCQPVAVLDQVLLPADEVHILEQHLDLAADEQALEGGIVDVHILDVDLLHLLGMALDAGERGFHVPQLALHGEGEGRHRAFHALEHIDAQQVDQALLAVDLAEEALAAANLGAVLLVVRLLLVRQHVAQRRVGGEIQAADFEVDLADRAELAGDGPRRP